MGTLPRPLLALLVAVVAVFAAWTVVLKPKSQSGASHAQVSNAVKQAVSKLNHPATKPATHTVSAAAARAAAKAKAAQAQAEVTAAKQASAAHRRSAMIVSALRADKVVAVLFYNPTGSDDQADLAELPGIPTHKGKIVKVAVPLSELSRYSEITNQVPVQGSPTFVVIDGHHRASTLAGFADQLELNQLVAGALAAK